jgi:hypothetical protein
MAFLVWNKNNAKHIDTDKNILSRKILNKVHIRDKPIVIISVAGQYFSVVKHVFQIVLSHFFPVFQSIMDLIAFSLFCERVIAMFPPFFTKIASFSF